MGTPSKGTSQSDTPFHNLWLGYPKLATRQPNLPERQPAENSACQPIQFCGGLNRHSFVLVDGLIFELVDGAHPSTKPPGNARPAGVNVGVPTRNTTACAISNVGNRAGQEVWLTVQLKKLRITGLGGGLADRYLGLGAVGDVGNPARGTATAKLGNCTRCEYTCSRWPARLCGSRM